METAIKKSLEALTETVSKHSSFCPVQTHINCEQQNVHNEVGTACRLSGHFECSGHMEY